MASANTETRTAWQDEADRPLPQPTKAERGATYGAYLVTDYFAVENRKISSGKWMIPYRSRRLMKLRLRLAEVRATWGSVLQTGMTDRPQSGQRIIGPLPIPAPRPRPDLRCKGQHNVSPDFLMPSDQLVIPGLTWQFRLKANRSPLPIPADLYYFRPGQAV